MPDTPTEPFNPHPVELSDEVREMLNSCATATLVGQSLGEKNPEGAAKYGWASVRLGLVLFGIGSKAMTDTTKLALLSSPVAGFAGMVIAWLVVRKLRRSSGFMDFIAMLGVAIPADEIVRILRSLEFDVVEEGTRITATTPDHRLDNAGRQRRDPGSGHGLVKRNAWLHAEHDLKLTGATRLIADWYSDAM